MTDELYGELSIISTKGNEDFARQVDDWIRQWRSEEAVALAQKEKVGADATLFDTDIHVDSFVASADTIRFADGEGKCVLHESMRGHDVYILCDLFNYGVTYKMYGVEQRMSPDDHYQDLKRIIGAIGGKARRISVVMPMIYEGRQDKRSGRESLDCAISLQELVRMGVTNIITFDVHNGGVMNAIPYHGFENVHPTYQMLKALVKKVPDISLTSDELVMFSPDEGGMARCVYYSSILGLDLSMFYKRRDYTRVVNGKNPIVAHEYLGGDIRGKDVIVVDDIIASGESMMDVARKIREMGARRVFLFASFGLFCEGLEKIDEAYENGYFDYLFTTNLVYRSPELLSRKWFVEVNLTKYVALLIDTLNHDRSISRLLSNAEKITNLQQAHMKHTEQN
ncbi:MAG: phosphoribosylpyrophosphate synthetase [Oscillospiraceae bacterium]|jgi:ribose-phosphate diphosphokinase|nr:MAG: phosphoribosylpyrophosphate synthetase [Oscillospiraceae bacterium]